MRKFLAVVKREYFKIVKSWAFVFGTLLLPFIIVLMAIVPVLLLAIKGNAVRLAIVDQSGAISRHLQENLSSDKLLEKAKEATADSFKNIDVSQDEKMKRTAQQLGTSFVFEEVPLNGRTTEGIRSTLNDRINQGTLDAYLIVPADYDLPGARFEYFSRNTSDFVAKEQIQEAIFETVKAHRLERINIDQAKLKEINKPIDFGVTKVSNKGEEKDSGLGFAAAFAVAFMIYITLTLYGQLIMGAVVEEKETRIAEVLFSSARPFQLLMGKLIGVGFAGLTQVAIWITSLSVLAGFAIVSASSSGIQFQLPSISAGFILYFLLYFLFGFFTFAAVFALLGAVVPSMQEAGAFAVVPVLLMLGGLYAVYPIIRDPNSTASIVLSMAPFTSPMAMPARIITEGPPFWQIVISVLFNIATVVFLTWTTSRVYRVGMLMYGKRATIPEIWRWIWQG